MKRLVLIFALIFNMTFESVAQDSFKDISYELIPQQFMDGSFYIPIMTGEMVTEVAEIDPVNTCIYTTYIHLSHLMMGTRIEEGAIEKNLSMIEEYLGRDNTIYGLALISKAREEEKDDLEVLLKAAEIIGETAGKDSWEYALVMFHCSDVTLDINKYGGPSKSLEYSEKCLNILEHDHKESWLYDLAITNKGAAIIYTGDGRGFDPIVKVYDGYGIDITPENLCPYVYVSLYLSTLYTSIGYHDHAIDIAEQLIPLLEVIDMTDSGKYLSANKTLCYAYAMKKNSKKAREYFDKAEQTCITRFGKDSKQHKGLQKYREMF